MHVRGFTKDSSSGVYHKGTFAGIMLYSLFESNILFLSGSSGTFLLSLLFSSYAIANTDMKNERKDFYEMYV